MIDTIAAYYRLDNIHLPLDDRWMAIRYVTDSRNDTVIRAWSQHNGARLNYRQIGVSSCVLSIEFSAARWCGRSRLSNIRQAEVDAALLAINQWITGFIGMPVNVQDWIVTRIDYAWMYQTDRDTDEYLSVFRSLSMARMARSEYEHGIQWRRGSRWVKWYDKAVEQGEGAGLLRFEVSNHRRACAYMARRWFACDRTVAELAQERRALYVLARMYDNLKLPIGEITSPAAIMFRLREVYGSSAHTALGAWHMLSKHGAAVVELGLMSRAMYYRWHKSLSAAGVLPMAERPLPPLSLPVRAVVLSAARILASADTPQAYIDPENLPKILGVRANIPERLYAEANQLG